MAYQSFKSKQVPTIFVEVLRYHKQKYLIDPNKSSAPVFI